MKKFNYRLKVRRVNWRCDFFLSNFTPFRRHFDLQIVTAGVLISLDGACDSFVGRALMKIKKLFIHLRRMLATDYN